MMQAKSGRMTKLFAPQERSSSYAKNEDLSPTDVNQVKAWLAQNTLDQLDQITVPLHDQKLVALESPTNVLASSIATLQICQEHWDDQDDTLQQAEFRTLIRRLDRLLEYLERYGTLFWDYRDRANDDPVFSDVEEHVELRQEHIVTEILTRIANLASRRPEMASCQQPTEPPSPITLPLRSYDQLWETEDKDTSFFLDEVTQRVIRLSNRPEQPIVAIASTMLWIIASTAQRAVRPDAECGRLIARM